MPDISTPTRSATTSPRQELKQLLRGCKSFPATFSIPHRADVSSWLASQTFATKTLWSDRDTDITIAGTGQARRVVADSSRNMDDVIRQCREILRGTTDVRFFGGFSFRRDDYEPSPEWAPFWHAQFVLPRFTHDGRFLRCVVMDEDDATRAARDIDALCEATPQTVAIPAPVNRIDYPCKSQWQTNVEDALELFETEVVEKVVLARRADFTFAETLSPIRLTQQLMAATPSCYHFCFQFDEGAAFIGATPERLIQRHGHRLLSEVVAGTRPRGQDEQLDQELATELLASAKDQLEHDIVRKSIRQRLHKYVNALEVDSQASILKLARKQHLYSGVRATLKADISDGELLERLHPTPAVGGYPTENALTEIARIEEFDRGWYAAPVGYVTPVAAEFAVAIRSGLVCDNMLSLFSGAGIVPGSTHEEEWNEIEHKISDFLEIIGR